MNDLFGNFKLVAEYRRSFPHKPMCVRSCICIGCLQQILDFLIVIQRQSRYCPRFQSDVTKLHFASDALEVIRDIEIDPSLTFDQNLNFLSRTDADRNGLDKILAREHSNEVLEKLNGND